MLVGQVLLGMAGFGVSFYSYYVKKQHEKNPKYKALCDFGPNASCSRVLNSKYSTGFGISKTLFGNESMMNASNTTLGMLFYALQIVFGLIPTPLFSKLALCSSVMAGIGSVYLGVILAFILKDFCLVCIQVISSMLVYSGTITKQSIDDINQEFSFVFHHNSITLPF